MAKFGLGKTTATPGALVTAARYGTNLSELLDRHACGDWGDVPAEDDARANETAVEDGDSGGHILSSYGDGNAQLWVITEGDRSVTTILRPDEY